MAQRVPHLAPREWEVLRLYAEEKSIGEIAALLFISYHTVKSHCAHIRLELDVHSMWAAVVLAIRSGWMT